MTPDWLKIPHVEDGMRVGLFGGSFNPPHAGHLHVAETAIERMALDCVWWMVSPGNPLKNKNDLAPLKDRISTSKALARNPKVKVTGFEAMLNMRYSADLIDHLLTRYPNVRFVWIMGADNLAYFHKWERWRDIAASIPICVIDRPGSTLATRSSIAARYLWRSRVDESDARLLPYSKAPGWAFIHAPRLALSSTALRAAKNGNS